MSLAYTGTLPADIWHVLHVAWKSGVSLQSDFARHHAHTVALAASLGWLSTIDPDGRAYRRQWRITAAGIVALQHKEHFT